MRKEYSSYYKKAVREAILNCYCHRDYFRRSNIKIEFFDDRCEIISPGGFHGGLTLEEALKGVQSFRNKFLVQLLHKLGYIENYSSGLNRIFKEYEKTNNKPKVLTSLCMFKVTFPNLNYGFDEGQVGTQNVHQNVYQNVHQKTDLEKIIYLIKNNSNVTLSDMADFIGKTVKTVQRIIKKTTNIKYVGSSKLGHWEIIEGENK